MSKPVFFFFLQPLQSSGSHDPHFLLLTIYKQTIKQHNYFKNV